jgi:ribosomal protein S2
MKQIYQRCYFYKPTKDSLAIQECLRLGIPTICIVDTNCNRISFLIQFQQMTIQVPQLISFKLFGK